MKKKKPSDIMKLYKSVEEYIESRGGKVIVIGGVQVQKWFDDPKYNFTLGIRITGKKPIFKEVDKL